MANETKRTSFVWELDASKYNNSLKGIKKETQLAKSEFKLAESSLKSFGKSTENLSNKQKALTKQIELHNKTIDIYTKSIDKSNKKVQEGVKKRSELEKELKKNTEAYKKVVSEQGKESKEAQELKTKIDSLKKEYTENEKAIERNINKSATHQKAINNSKVEINKLEGELKEVNRELEKSTNKMLIASKNLDTFGNKAQSAGSKLNSVGNGVLKVTAPLALGIAAATKQFMEFEKGVAKTGTIADTTKLSLEQIKDGIIELSNETGVATEDLNEAMYQALSAGVDTADAISFLAEANYLAKGGFTSTTSAVDLLTTVLNAYGLEAEKTTEISDMLIQTQNLGKTSVDQLASSMGKVIPTAKAGGVEFKQLSSAMALLTQKGIATSEATTYLNSMINELSKSGTKASTELKSATGKTFQQLMKDGVSLGEVMAKLETHAKKSGKGLGDMFGSAEAGKAALTLATESGKEFNKILKSMEDSAGSTKTAFDKMMDTKSENLNVAVNKLKNNFMKLGESAVPLVDELAKLIGKLADFLGSLSDEQMESIVNFTKWGVIIGGSTKILGGTLNAVGSTAKGISKLTGILGKSSKATSIFGTATKVASGAKGVAGLGKATALAGGSKGVGLLSTALKLGTKLISPWGLALGVGTAVAVGLGKKLKEEVVPEVDLFSERLERSADGAIIGSAKFDEATKKIVGAYMDMDTKATESLLNLQFSGQVITEQIATDMKNQYSQMGKAITSELNKDYNNNLEIMKTFFVNSATLTAEEQAKALETLKINYENEKTTTASYLEQIYAIYDAASKEKRGLKLSEKQEIERLQGEMRTNALQCMTEQEEQTNVILARMQSYNGRITAETVGEHVRQLEDARVKAVDSATKEYNERIKVAEQMKQQGGKEAEELANKIIDEAERQRDDSIELARETKEKGLDKLEESYSNLRQEVDTDSGEILTWWDRLKNWWNGWNPAPKTVAVNYQGNNNIGYNASPGKSNIRSNTRSYDRTAFAPQAVFGNRMSRANIERNFDYNKIERMVKNLENTIIATMQNGNSIYLDSDKLVGGTIGKTDRELARIQAIENFGFKR